MVNNILDAEIQLAAVREVRTILEKGWCRFHMAIDILGNEVPCGSSEACKHCLLGAIYASAKRLSLNPTDFKIFFHRVSGLTSLTIFNDCSDSKEEVLELVDNVIKDLEAGRW